ncbi:class I SAM-dependent methyltransferase [Clostridium butyricum]|uniref:class I SAM-dependent methyltransferase n=1 Tax=Clostridium butyricum TaxID=1492 RepID=UPI0024B9D6C3|nr:class I SAM-dependent methyltransferase [Clostridium butyricum]
MKNWEYHNPKFESDKLNYDLLRYAPWSGHRNFVYDFVVYFNPEVIVELGSHYGCSAFTFAQAIKDYNLDSKLYAIDTWAGDDYTRNDYENDVYSVFRDTVANFYQNQKIEMLRMTFDQASSKFKDKSIDVLHIDGSHHYEDVKHDFYSWLPKVKDDGIIFLHDISEDIVLDGKMGSNRFWNELKEVYNNTIEFDFSWGLGIIFLSENKFLLLNDIDLKKYQRINNELAVQYREELRKQHFILKDNNFYIDSLKEQIEIKNTHLSKYNLDIESKDKYIKELQDNIEKWKENVEGKDKYIDELNYSIRELNSGIDNYAVEIKGKNNYINELETKLEELNETLNTNNIKIVELNEILNENKLKIETLEEEINKSFLKKLFRR